jgi:hypothetical protein
MDAVVIGSILCVVVSIIVVGFITYKMIKDMNNDHSED